MGNSKADSKGKATSSVTAQISSSGTTGDGDDDGAGALVGRIRRLEGRHREAAPATLCPAQAVLPRQSQVGGIISIQSEEKKMIQEKSSSTISHITMNGLSYQDLATYPLL